MPETPELQPIDPNTSGAIFSEAEKIYNLLFDEFLFPAHIVHRAQFDSNAVKMCPLLSPQFIGQVSHRRRGSFDLAAYVDTIAIDGSDPVDVPEDIGADINVRSPRRALTTIRRSAPAVAVLHSDQSQDLISGRGNAALPGDLPADLSMAASLKPIPAKPPGGKPVTGQRHRKALATPHSRARAA
ncbi:hypothetical protein [Phyllobacterium chamaecytisi]|uniref:hypothetical protein n=1 Tax=Phyllobacterium chamaecytisi TaxID=2876082 RepID=UPI001CCEB005|nr:hypothetical protein [Phyllobacterium sp. KW56]MBZ9603168.1 hypothetical protein [Phyllobacterium sp. KW56]